MSKMSEGLNLHIMEEEEEEEAHSTGPHFDSGPLQPPSPQFYYQLWILMEKQFSLEEKKAT